MAPKNKKRSFFERLTGSVDVDGYDDFDDQPNEVAFDDQGYYHDQPEEVDQRGASIQHSHPHQEERWLDDEEEEGQLTVDVFQTPDELVIKSIVAGVNPSDLDVSITRDMVTIRGKRDEKKEVSEENYFHKELYWGSFSRTILLPTEIEVEGAQAGEKHGLLTIRLPKVDKEKSTKLKVKVG